MRTKSLLAVSLSAALLLSACSPTPTPTPVPTPTPTPVPTPTPTPVPTPTPTPETINGIIVPPEPDETINNASIQGVDMNTNGVRDDVERRIAFNSNSETYLNNYYLAKELSGFLTINPVSRSEILNIYSNVHCVISNKTPTIDSSQIESYIFNTEERIKTLQKVKNNLHGYGSDDLTPCAN